MKNILITGTGRGIGLELCRQYLARGAAVYATCREASPALAATGATVIDNIDVGSDHCIAALSAAMSGITLDLVLCNAGILTLDSLDDFNFADIRQQFETNTLGPLRVVNTLRPNLVSGSRIGIVTSRVGSIGDNGSGGIYGYRVSKAGANMVGKNLANDLKDQGIAVMLLHPGLVATEMTGGRGIEPESAAAGLIDRIDSLSIENTGTFWHAEGYALPW